MTPEQRANRLLRQLPDHGTAIDRDTFRDLIAIAIQKAEQQVLAQAVQIAKDNAATWTGGLYGLYFDGQDATSEKIASDIRKYAKERRQAKRNSVASEPLR